MPDKSVAASVAKTAVIAPVGVVGMKIFGIQLADWAYIAAIASGFVFAGNLLALETWIWPLFLFVAVILFVYLCFRVYLEKMEETNAPDSKIAAYALVPVHTYFGLFQKIFMFWHAPFETRVLVFDNYFWCVHRGRFMRFNRAAWKWSNKVRWVSIGRPLTKEEIDEANSLVGKRSIYGIKDCRKLMVAGNPKKYMKG